MKWYVIQTKPRKEDDVSGRFSATGMEVLNARIRSVSIGFKPLFPNYIFLRWNLADAANYHMIKYTRGVARILGTPEYPVPISDDAIEVIRERLNKKDVLENLTMRTGSHVRVRSGLLRDLVGVLEKPVSADGRVAVLLKIHEREMKAMFRCKDIALVA